MRMSLSRRDGLFGDPGADTIHGRGQREHVTQSVVSIIILTYIYYYLVWYQISIESTGSFKIINVFRCEASLLVGVSVRPSVPSSFKILYYLNIGCANKY